MLSAPDERLLIVVQGMRRALVSWMGQNCQRTPRGICVAASLALRDALGKSGYQARVARGLFRGYGHAWVEVGDLIIDITSDQFEDGNPTWIIEGSDGRYCDAPADDESFQHDMGPVGDGVLITDIDADGEEFPLGTTIEIAQALTSLYGT